MNRYLNNSSLFHGITPLGTELRNQVLNDIVSQARARRLPKPVLVITITDGIPFGEPKSVLRDAILFATTEVARTKYGPGAISFQFAQVGNDMDAQAFLEELDSDPKIGHLVDCTSNMKQESAQMLRANPSVVLTEPLWVLKMLLGAIDSSYDTQDEVTFGPSIQSYVPPPAQEDTHGTSSQQQGTRQAGPPGPPPSYSLEPPQQPAHGQQGYADTSSPQQQGRRSIFHRSKEALGRVRSFRGSKGA